jgi:hypothetical protein
VRPNIIIGLTDLRIFAEARRDKTAVTARWVTSEEKRRPVAPKCDPAGMAKAMKIPPSTK